MINVLKIGGGAGIEPEAALQNLVARVRDGERWILVHGASDAANALGEQVGYPAQTIITPGGHSSRYTDPRTLDIYCAAAATVNQRITARLNHIGVSSVGLASPNVVNATRKTAIRALREGRQILIRDDYSGTINGINVSLLWRLLDAGFLPVVAPIALGAEGERLNVDGDLVAAHIARALEAETLLILSNVPGLLRDVENPASLISGFDLTDFDDYERFAAGRMKKKLMAAQIAQVRRVILSDARLDHPLDTALSGAGTHIAGVVEYAG
jgi:[amino group carrier protein]-L-2-aminoadipate 6-kinase